MANIVINNEAALGPFSIDLWNRTAGGVFQKGSIGTNNTASPVHQGVYLDFVNGRGAVYNPGDIIQPLKTVPGTTITYQLSVPPTGMSGGVPLNLTGTKTDKIYLRLTVTNANRNAGKFWIPVTIFADAAKTISATTNIQISVQ